jgi:hypothetical protein
MLYLDDKKGVQIVCQATLGCAPECAVPKIQIHSLFIRACVHVHICMYIMQGLPAEGRSGD